MKAVLRPADTRQPTTEPLRRGLLWPGAGHVDDQEAAVTDKSPHSSLSKKCAETIKEKRAKRKAKTDVTSQMEKLTSDNKA